MPGRVLRKRGVVEKDGDAFRLLGAEALGREQVEELSELLQSKLDGFKDRRGKKLWQHRKAASGYIPGSARYEVLKRAKFRCELCGVSADVKALEADHIVPRSKGGSDDPANLQALCYSCNATKRDKDDADFRCVAESYDKREPGCPICDALGRKVVAENVLCVALGVDHSTPRDEIIIAPKRHVANYFDLAPAELRCAHILLETIRVQAGRDSGGQEERVSWASLPGPAASHCFVRLSYAVRDGSWS